MRLIDADALNRKKKYSFQTAGLPFPKNEWFIKVSDVFAAPTIEAEPVRHGRWVKQTIYRGTFWESVIVCSACHYRNEKQTNCCPNCGAKMDLEE